MLEAAWFRMNRHQVSRFGPGRRFGEVRRRLEAEISIPSFLSSPWIRRLPQRGFSVLNRHTSSWVSSGILRLGLTR
jgi:hypothetical protein